MNIEFHGKTVIVTGAAHGFGRAIALGFSSRGANVWACDLLADELAETRRLCQAAGGLCEVRTVDVTDRNAIFAFVREAEASTPAGRVDILVNNAGGVLGQVGRPLEEVGIDDWNSIIAVNLSAAFFFAQATAPGMKASQVGTHRQHLQRGRIGRQPDRHPGLRLGQGRPDQPDPPTLS